MKQLFLAKDIRILCRYYILDFNFREKMFRFIVEQKHVKGSSLLLQVEVEIGSLWEMEHAPELKMV